MWEGFQLSLRYLICWLVAPGLPGVLRKRIIGGRPVLRLRIGLTNQPLPLGITYLLSLSLELHGPYWSELRLRRSPLFLAYPIGIGPAIRLGTHPLPRPLENRRQALVKEGLLVPEGCEGCSKEPPPGSIPVATISGGCSGKNYI